MVKNSLIGLLSMLLLWDVFNPSAWYCSELKSMAMLGQLITSKCFLYDIFFGVFSLLLIVMFNKILIMKTLIFYFLILIIIVFLKGFILSLNIGLETFFDFLFLEIGKYIGLLLTFLILIVKINLKDKKAKI
jgi:hypothetical protein